MSAETVKYEETTKPSYTFEGLKANTTYTIYSYVENKSKMKSNVYETEVTTNEYKEPIINKVTFERKLYTIKAIVDAKGQDGEIETYHYYKDGELIASIPEAEYTYEGLSDTSSYDLKIEVEDNNHAKSTAYEETISTLEYVYPEVESVDVTDQKWNSVTLTTNVKKSTNDVTEYKYQVEKKDGTVVQEWFVGTKNQVIENLEGNQEYNVKIKVKDSVGRESKQEYIQAISTSEYNYVQIKVSPTISTDSIKLDVSATPGDGTITKYMYSKNGGDSWEEFSSTEPTNSYTFESLTSDTEFPIWVKVIDSNNKESNIYKETIKTSKEIIINFNKNGNDIEAERKSCIVTSVEESCTITTPIISKNNNTPDIIGYSLQAEDHSKVVGSGEELTVKREDDGKTYYAQTKKDAVTRKVKFDPNGNTSFTYGGTEYKVATEFDLCTIDAIYNNNGGHAQSEDCSITITMPTIKAHDNTKTLIGWSTEAGTHEGMYKSGQEGVELTAPNDLVYYAQTTAPAIIHTLTTNGNGGSGNNQTISCTRVETFNGTYQAESCSVTLPANPYTYDGWTFNNWSMNNIAESGSAPNTDVVLTDNVTYYALWKDITAPVISEVYSGGMVYEDPTFANGLNGVGTYNNSSNGNVTITRETASTGVGNNQLKILTKGEASPGLGGFYFGTPTTANEKFITRIRAKIPKGYKINYGHNSATSIWLTSQDGTGEWEEYVGVLTSLRDVSENYYYITGTAATASNPVTWYVSYATVYSNQDLGIKAGASFKATDAGSKIVGYGINQSDTTEPAYTPVSEMDSIARTLENITTNGTYYIWIKDKAGNKANSKVVVDKVGTKRTAIFNIGTNVNAVGGASSSCMAEYGKSCNVTLPSITPASGYLVDGYYNGATRIGNVGDSITLNSDVIYTANVGSVDFKLNSASTSEMKVTATVSPASTPLTGYQYSTDNNNWTTSSTTNTNTFSVNATSSYTLYVKVTDKQNNTVTKSISYTNPSVGTVTVSNPKWNSLDVSVTATKGTADIAKYYFSSNDGTSFGGAVANTTTTGTTTLTGLEPGTEYNIKAYVEDANGRRSENSETRKGTTADYVYPTVKIISAVSTATTITINASATNGTGTIKAYRYFLEGTQKIEKQSTSLTDIYTIDSGITEGNTYTVKVQVVDSNNKVSTFTTDNQKDVKAIKPIQDVLLAAANKDGVTTLYHHDSSLEGGAQDDSYRYAGGGYSLVSPYDNQFERVFATSFAEYGTGNLIRFFCNTSESSPKFTCNSVNNYYILANNENIHYDSFYKALSQALKDGYIKENVENYVCLDGEKNATGECANGDSDLYRIIGLFKNISGQYEMKLIKYDYATNNQLGSEGAYSKVYDLATNMYKGNRDNLTSIGIFYWTSKSNKINEWSGSALKETNLNSYYLNTYLKTTRGIDVDNLIETHKWDVNGHDTDKAIPKVMYDNEMNKIISSPKVPTVTKAIDAKIGLMYASDYGYAVRPSSTSNWTTILDVYGTFQDENWMFMGLCDWTISRYSENNMWALYIYNGGGLDYNSVYLSAYAVRPSFYLKSGVQIKEGDGSKMNPYRIGL